jgi:hypothetical protein
MVFTMKYEGFPVPIFPSSNAVNEAPNEIFDHGLVFWTTGISPTEISGLQKKPWDF